MTAGSVVLAVSEEVWCAQASSHFELRIWDDEAVVYVHASGSTHALSPSASAVLATLLEHPAERLSAGQWLALMSAGDDEHDTGPADEQDLQALLAVLGELESVGLAVRHAP